MSNCFEKYNNNNFSSASDNINTKVVNTLYQGFKNNDKKTRNIITKVTNNNKKLVYTQDYDLLLKLIKGYYNTRYSNECGDISCVQDISYSALYNSYKERNNPDLNCSGIGGPISSDNGNNYGGYDITTVDSSNITQYAQITIDSSNIDILDEIDSLGEKKYLFKYPEDNITF
jgi:hypothetical protein